MRKISNYKNKVLQKEQFSLLNDVITTCVKRGVLGELLKSLLTSSERAYLSQRVEIFQKLAHGKNYAEIELELGAFSNTIAKAREMLDETPVKIFNIISATPKKDLSEKTTDDSGPITAHCPGAIKI